MLETQTATREQLSNKQIYRLNIERDHFVYDRRVSRAFNTNQQGLFNPPTSVYCDSQGVAKSLEARFMTVLARWINFS